MISTSTMYWITRLDGINNLCMLFTAIGCVCGVFCIILKCDLKDISINWAPSEYKSSKIFEVRAWFKRLFVISIVGAVNFVLGVALPTTKEAIVIWATPQILNNEEVQKLPKNAVSVCNAWLREQLKEQENTND